MDIIFLITKILYILMQVLGFVVLFILFVILVLFFAKLKYQVKVNTIHDETEDKNYLNANVRLNYLFSAIKVFADKKKDNVKILVKVFGKDVYKDSLNVNIDDIKKHVEDVKKDVREDIESDIQAEKDEVVEEFNKEYENSEFSNTENSNDSLSQKPNDLYTSENSNTKSKKEEKVIQKEEKKRLKEEKKKIKAEKKKLKAEKKFAKEKEKEIESGEGENLSKKLIFHTIKSKEAIKIWLKAISNFFKSLKPQRFVVRGKIGFDDPSTTGKLIGLAYTIRGVTNLDIILEGDFEKAIFPDVFCYVKGDLSIFKIIHSFIPVAFYYIKFIIKLKLSQLFNRKKGD